MNYWSPTWLSVAGAGLTVIALMPVIWPGIGLRRWYQVLVLVAVIVICGAVTLTVVYSSPWVMAGVALVLLVIVAAWNAQRQMTRRIEDEALGFLQSLIGLMSAGNTLEQALRMAAQNPEISRGYPRLGEQARTIIGLIEGGTVPSTAVRQAADSVADRARNIWEQIATVFRLVEDGREIAPDVQRDTLQTAMTFLIEAHAVNQTLRQKMMQMELAKWVMVLILPLINVFMAFQIPDYVSGFLLAPVGALVLGIELLALLIIFVVFAYLQRLPEVRI